MLQFIHQADTSQAAKALAERLVSELQADKQVVWLVCGGSSIAVAVAAMQAIQPALTANLTIMLTDERYGTPGHADSNWQQLYSAGFQPGQARIIETLQPGLTLEDTCTTYAAALRNAVEPADTVIAQFGIGGDGHIAGILPHTTAVDSQQWVAGYDAGAFIRITITPPVWQHIDVAYAFVYGDTKHGTLARLHTEDLPVADQPAQLLKTVAEAYIYTDQAV